MRPWPAVSILLIALPLAAAESPLAPPEKEKNQPALTIDNWQPKDVPKPPAPAPEPEEKPAAAAKAAEPEKAAPPAQTAPAATEAPKPAVTAPEPAVPTVAMNEIVGTISNIDTGAGTIRLTTPGGISPELGWDEATMVTSKGKKLKMSDLQIGDKIAARYVGRQLTARIIEKL